FHNSICKTASLPNYPTTQLQNYSIIPILALPSANLPRISLHSSQNDNVVLFSVVCSSSRNETNRFKVNHLHAAIARFPQTVEILRTGRVPVAQAVQDRVLDEEWLTTSTQWNCA